MVTKYVLSQGNVKRKDKKSGKISPGESFSGSPETGEKGEIRIVDPCSRRVGL